MCRGGGEKLQIFENNYDPVILSWPGQGGWGVGGGGVKVGVGGKRETKKGSHVFGSANYIFVLTD